MIDYARGTYISFLFDNDMMAEGCFARAIQLLKSNSHLLMVYGDYSVHDSSSDLSHKMICLDESKGIMYSSMNPLYVTRQSF